MEVQELLKKFLVEKEAEYSVKNSEVDSGKTIYNWSSYLR